MARNDAPRGNPAGPNAAASAENLSEDGYDGRGGGAIREDPMVANPGRAAASELVEPVHAAGAVEPHLESISQSTGEVLVPPGNGQCQR